MTENNDLHVPHDDVPIKPWRLYVRIVFLVVVTAGTGLTFLSMLVREVHATELREILVFGSFFLFFPFSIINTYYTIMLLKTRNTIYYKWSTLLNRIYFLLVIIFIGVICPYYYLTEPWGRV